MIFKMQILMGPNSAFLTRSQAEFVLPSWRLHFAWHVKLAAHYNHLESFQTNTNASHPSHRQTNEIHIIGGRNPDQWYFCNSTPSVLVQAAITKYWVAYKQQNFFFFSLLGARSPRTGCQHVGVLGGPSTGLQTADMLYPPVGNEGWASSLALS